MAATLGLQRDTEISRLTTENRVLAQDLKQCQTDKDFVWSLWKKLQATNPDVTQAVSLVVQREREKAEIRDRKVLEILEMKDAKIEELEKRLTVKTKELGESTIRHVDTHDEVARLQREADILRDRNATLELQLKKLKTGNKANTASKKKQSSNSKVRNAEDRERNTDHAHKRTAVEADADKRELLQKLQSLGSDMEKLRTEKADELALRIQMENKVRVLDMEVTQKVNKFEDLVRELEEARSLLRRFESQARQQQHDLDYKNQELETVRKELAELWTTHNQLAEHSGQQADLIRQIQSIQTDTQKMLKNQEDAYTMENSSLQQMYTDLTSRYDQAKKMETDLRQQILVLKKERLDRDDVISELQSLLDKEKQKGSVGEAQAYNGSFITERVEPVRDMEYKVRSMQREIDNLRTKLKEKDRHIDDLEEDVVNQTIEFDVARLNRHERTHSTPAREFRNVGLSPMKAEVTSRPSRSQSVSPTRNRRDLPFNRHKLQKDLDDAKTILRLKVKELAELKKAHSKRLERLKSVQENYKNVKDQLKSLEGEYYGSKRKQKAKRADPKDLRHEDSTAVWNELAYFKNENRNLVSERMTLEEEVDSLRVQASQDAATVHELRVTLEQEREERAYERKKIDKDIHDRDTRLSEVALLKAEVQNKDVIIDRLNDDLGSARVDRDSLMEEKRLLKSEIMEMKKEASQHRMDTADLKRDIQRLKRELEEEQMISKMATAASKQNSQSKPGKTSVVCKKGSRYRNNNSVTRKYQQSLNSSKKEMRRSFEGGFEEEDWEELEESEEEEESEDQDIGRRIVKRCRFAETKPVADQLRQRRAYPMKQTARASQAANQHVHRLQPRSAERHRMQDDTREPSSSSSGDNITQRVLRDAGTSPNFSPMRDSPVAGGGGIRKTSASVIALRQLKPMKQRVGYLQQQVITLRDSRAAALKALEEQRQSNTQLQSDLTLANQRLRMTKQNIQKLSTDLDRVTLEKNDLEARLGTRQDSGPSGNTHTDHEFKVLESRLKSATNELSRQNAAVRQLKQENATSQDQIRQMEDKMNRMERDLSQKRSLLDDQRSRMRTTLENAKSDAESLLAVEMKVKLLQDTNDKNKVQLESYKKRLGAVTREKREYEERFLKLAADVEKKNNLLLDCQSKKMDMECGLAEMERTAKQQLTNLAQESEAAIETAQEKLSECHLRTQRYQYFVQELSRQLLRRVQQARAVAKEESHRKSLLDKSNSSMQRAQDVAKNILNISQSDLDDIMSADRESAKLEAELEALRRRDKKWVKKLEKLQQGKDDFAITLVELFMQKIEERNDLTARLHVNRTDQSDVKINNS